jgi:hypothetical protein
VLSQRVLLLNASFDGGLEDDGAVFAALLSSLRPNSSAGSATAPVAPLGAHPRKDVQHVVVAGTNHASICWAPEALSTISTFLRENDA